MKHFLEVFFIAMTVILLTVGQTGLAIWSGMFAVITLMVSNPDLKMDYHAVPEESGKNK